MSFHVQKWPDISIGGGEGKKDRMKNRKKKSWGKAPKEGSTVLGLNPVNWYDIRYI